MTYHAAYEPLRCVRTQRWNYIRRFGDRVHPVLCNCDDGPSKSLWLKQGWKDCILGREEAYDLFFDPNERANLVTVPAFQQTLAELRGRLDRWMHVTNDPLLAGPVNPPHGATIDDPDSTSPGQRTRIVG